MVANSRSDWRRPASRTVADDLDDGILGKTEVQGGSHDSGAAEEADSGRHLHFFPFGISLKRMISETVQKGVGKPPRHRRCR